jgi:hypothetical protein
VNCESDITKPEEVWGSAREGKDGHRKRGEKLLDWLRLKKLFYVDYPSGKSLII